MEQLSEII